MKLIRQNDEAGGLVLTQNLAGKARKQNYNFGKAWKSYTPGTIYVDIPKTISQGSEFSIMFFQKNKGGDFLGDSFIRSSLGVAEWGFMHWGKSQTRQYTKKATRDTGIYDSVQAYVSDGLNGRTFTSTNSMSSVMSTSSLNIPSIFLNRTINVNTYVKISGLAIYDRAITIDEIIYRNNNKLGNELLNLKSLWALYPLSDAKILNTSGVDFVGIEDISGNNSHAPILNLPSGTLQEQLDYANANLFEEW